MAIDINELEKFKRSSQRTVALSSIAGGVVILGLLLSFIGTWQSTEQVEEKTQEVARKQIEISQKDNLLQELEQKKKMAAEAERYLTNGVKLAERRQLTEAIEEYKKAIELNPDSANTYQFLGYAYFARHRYYTRQNNKEKLAEYPNDLNDSVEALEKAVQIDPEHIWALYNLSLAYWATGEKDKAVDTARKILSLDESFRETIANDGQFKKEFLKLLAIN